MNDDITQSMLALKGLKHGARPLGWSEINVLLDQMIELRKWRDAVAKPIAEKVDDLLLNIIEAEGVPPDEIHDQAGNVLVKNIEPHTITDKDG